MKASGRPDDRDGASGRTRPVEVMAGNFLRLSDEAARRVFDRSRRDAWSGAAAAYADGVGPLGLRRIDPASRDVETGVEDLNERGAGVVADSVKQRFRVVCRPLCSP